MKILNKRLLRNLRRHIVRYSLITMIFLLGTAVFVAIVSATDSIVSAIQQLSEDSNCEDGYFILSTPLKQKQEQKLIDSGVELEKNFYINIKDKNSGVMYRIYGLRKKINLVQIRTGEVPKQTGELLMEQHFADSSKHSIGDGVRISDKEFQVTGTGYSIDYDSLYKDGDGPYPDYKKFCLAFVTEEQLKELCSVYPAQLCYSYKFQGNDHIGQEELHKWLQGLTLLENDIKESTSLQKARVQSGDSTLLSFVPKEDNQRIISFTHDVSTNKGCVLPMGIVFFIVLSFLIAVLAVTDVKKQYGTIGTLYALGYSRNELTAHFIRIPVIVTICSCITGTILGFFCAPAFMGNYVQGGCITDVKRVIPLYLLAYGIICPIAVSFLVNWIVVRKALGKPVVMLLKNLEYEKAPKISWQMKKFGFKYKFQVRQFVRESFMYLLLMVSLFMTIFMVVFGMALYGTLDRFKEDCENTITYDYKYLYRYPDEGKPTEGEIAYERFYRAHAEAVNLDFTVELIGIQKESTYFGNCAVGCDTNEVVISSSIRDKFNWEIGDVVTLTDSLNNEQRSFLVSGVIPLAYGMYIFTDINQMREYYGVGEQYWNVVYSDNPIRVNDEQLLVELEKTACIKGAESRIDSLMGIILTLLLMGIFVFIGMLYMMVSIMVEKWGNSIGMMKVMGFRQSEVIQMYLLNSLVIVAVSAILAIPVSLMIVSAIYPHIISTIPNGMLVQYPVGLLCTTVFIIFLSWAFVFVIMSRRIKRISAIETLRKKDNG